MGNVKSFMKVMQTDELNGHKFIAAAQARDYSMFAFMYHPEY